METGFLNLHDEEHFSTLPSLLCAEDILEDSEVCLLDMIQDDFASCEISVSRNFDAPDLWDTDQELNGDMGVLPLAVPVDGGFTKLESHSKEDFQKMLAEWQDHLGSLQASDTEDMDVKDMMGLDMLMPKHMEHFPDDIFDNDVKPLVSQRKHMSPMKLGKKSSAFGITVKDELNKFTFDCLIRCKEDNGMGLSVAEDKAVESGTVSVEDVECDLKVELDDDCIDVETVSEQIPVLEAGDLTSLLEQFEASEAFNTNTNSKPSVLDTHLYAMATQQLPPSTLKGHNVVAAAPLSSTKGHISILSHQNIKDSLPKEVIDRIKASGRKKAVPVIPAMPSRRSGRGGTRMQDAGAALSRNKLLKIVSSGGGGESVQLDHDYCTISTSSMDVAPQPFYHSDASEYIADKVNLRDSEDKIRCNEKSYDEGKVYSRLPEYYMVLAPQRIERNDIKGKKMAVRDDESWGESNSKKDSGLESGEVSDASEEIAVSPGDSVQHSNKCLARDRTGKKPVLLKSLASKTSLLSSNGKNCTNVLSVNGKDYHVAAGIVNGSKLSSGNAESVSLKTGKEMTMISVLKKCQIGNVPNACGNNMARSNSVSSEGLIRIKEEPQEPKKRKLNLQEYRSRLKELDRKRGSREDSCGNSPSCSSSVSVGTSMVEDAKDNSNTTSVVCAKPDASGEETVSVAVDEGSVVCETVLRPMMLSVEVQTVPEDAVPVGYDTGKHARQEDEKERRESRTRDRRKRQYRTRHSSNSSSSGSSSSGNSHSSRRHHTSLRSRHRHRSSCSSHSRSRSRSTGAKTSCRSPSGASRRRRHQSQYDHHGRNHRRSDRNYAGYRGWRRSRSPQRCNRKNIGGDWQLNEREKQRQVEERRVIYVGRIEEGTSKAELRRRFEMFGPIVDISVHFREHGDNYGFVTFAYKVDAYEAVEHGNDDPNQPRYDLCFGGRRAFCKTRYSDLDGMATKNDPLCTPNLYMRGAPPDISKSRTQNENSFDLLLREAKAKLHKRKA